MEKEKVLVPQLRFPHYEDKWYKKKLEEACDMKAGKFVSASKIKDKPNISLNACYGGNGIRGYVNSFTHEGLYSLIGRQGAHCGNIKLVDGHFHATEHAVVVTPKKDIDTNWLYFALCVLKLNQYATGQAQPGISVSNINKVKLKIPKSLPEQQKIANFLSAIDKQIQILEKKKKDLETYKKGLLQNIFKQKNRFKDENGNEFPDWKKNNLGYYLNHKSNRNKKLEVKRVLSVSNSKGFILQSIQFDNHRVASKDVSNYKIVSKNDIAYNPSRINVGSIATLKDFENGIVSPMYVVFGLKKTLDLTFFENLINTHLFKHLVKVGCSGSVRDSLNFDDLESFKLQIPCIKEQIKIANFLTAIDKNIQVVNEKIAHTKTYKKGLLQKMFV